MPEPTRERYEELGKELLEDMKSLERVEYLVTRTAKRLEDLDAKFDALDVRLDVAMEKLARIEEHVGCP